MRMNKCAYLFAAALVAGTVGMTSCSNEDVAGIENIQGQETKIALGMSVALPVQTKAATTADEVNFGAGVADIQNVTIVPMVKMQFKILLFWDYLMRMIILHTLEKLQY